MVDPSQLPAQDPSEAPKPQPTPTAPSTFRDWSTAHLFQGHQSALALEAYQQPLTQQIQFQPGTTKMDPGGMTLMQAYFKSLLAHPLETGQTPNTAGSVFNQLADGQAEQMRKMGTPELAGYAARQVYDNTVGAFIKQAQTDPLLAVGEVLGTAALFAGAGALDVATGGLATPLLWTGFAMFALPSLLPSFTQSVQNVLAKPDDVSMAQLLISSATMAITVGSPIKAFRGIGAHRSLLAQQARNVQLIHQPGEAVQLLMRNRAGKEDQFLLPEDRFPIIPQTVDELEKEVSRRQEAGLPIEDDEMLARLRTATHEHDILASRVQGLELGKAAVEGGERPRTDTGQFRTRQDYLDQVNKDLQAQAPGVAESEQALLPIMKEFGHRWGYRIGKENPMGRIQPEELAQIPAGVRERADKAFRSIYGILYSAGEGHGYDGAPEGLMHSDFASTIAEQAARGQAAGSIGQGQNLAQTHFLEAIKHMGIAPDKLEKIYGAIHGHKDPMEDAKLWDGLTPHEKYMAEKVNVMFGIMTTYAYKHGHMELPISRYVPWMVTHDEVEGGRGVRATRAMQEALAPSTRAVQSRRWQLARADVATGEGLESEHDIANALTNAEFDESEGMPSMADRYNQAGPTRAEFNGGEQEKRAAHTQYAQARAVFKDPREREINGKMTTANQFLLEKRREHGQYRRQVNDAKKNLDSAPEKLGGLVRQVNQDRETLKGLEAQRTLLKGNRGAGAARAQMDQQMKQLRASVRKNLTAHKALSEKTKQWQASFDEYKGKLDSMPAQWVKQAGLEGVPDIEKWFRVGAKAGDAADVGGITRDELKAKLNAEVGGRYLLSGMDLPRVSFARYMRQMNQTRYREAALSHAYTPASQDVKLAYGAKTGMSISEIGQLDQSERPTFTTADIEVGQRNTDAHQALYDSGYEMFMPAIGRRGALNFQPAIFGRKDLIGKYRQLSDRARSASDQQAAFAQTFLWQALLGVPRKLIMGSPMWHGKNVTGRAVATLLQHPGLAGQAMVQLLKDRFHDPDMYYQTKMEHWQNGGVPANRYNVHEHLGWLEQELSGQRNFGTAIRHPAGTLGHAHAQLAEGWFWKTVDDVGTMAYLVQKSKFQASKPWMSENMAGMMAAEYANNVTGMVNPLYMDKAWRQARQMIFFAPGWWTTFMRTFGMALPGSTRMSALLKDTKFAALDPVKMNSLDIRHRKEMVRAHRSYFTTMMAAALVSHDMMNYLFSGHHIWENAKGHEWDLEMDKEYAPKIDQKTGQTQHVHLHSIQFYSQMADLLNATGMGHDWGFMHQMNTDSFQSLDAAHKMAVIGTSLKQGVQQTAAGKLSTGINIGIGAGAGIDPYSLIRDQQIQKIPNWEALLGALPGGYYAQRQIDQYRRASERAQITGEPSTAAQEQAKILPTFLKAAGSQFMGLPSLYYSGDEPVNGYHFLTEDQTNKYLNSRQAILSDKKKLSDKLLQGNMSPNDWVVQNEMQTQKYQQLLADTFGDQSTGKNLFDARRNLYTKYKLDDLTLSRQQFEYNLQQFQQDWQDQMDHASPQAKAMWWETHTSMWTDADYLYWMTSQMRQAVASHIDGEGGRHIREAQRRLGAQGLPLDPAATDALRKQDPYLWTYQQVMSSLGKNTMLGALTAAYHDPFSNFTVYPDDMGPLIQALDQAGALRGGAPMVPAGEMQQLGQQARGLGQATAPEGGNLAGTPQGQQAGAGLSVEGAQELLAADAALSPNSTKHLSPETIQWLESVAGGGRPSG